MRFTFRPRLGQDRLHPFLELLGAPGHRGGGLLGAVIDRGPALLEGLGDAAPVVDILPVPKEDAVDQHQGIAGGAVLVLGVEGLQVLAGQG